MSFGAAGYLLFLLLLPVAGAALAAGLAWRRRAAARFGRTDRRPTVARYAVPSLLLAALGLAALAAARPQFGAQQSEAPQRGIDAVIVLDVSQSMLAGDGEPSRLGRAQAEIAALLDRLSGDRVGLVVFAGAPFVRAPLTSDLGALGELVAGVDGERGLVAPGSDLGAGIEAARGVLANGQAQSKVMLVVSDGEDRAAGVTPAVTAAAAAGIRVYAAGAGSGGGAPVRDLDPDTGALRPRLDASGAPVITKLDAAELQALAAAGGGRYVALAGDGRPLAGLAADFGALRPTDFGSRTSTTRIERFQLFAALALVALLAATLAPLLPGASETWRRAARLLPLAGAGLLAGAVCAAGVATVNRRGNDQYAEGNDVAALNLYRTAQALAPSRAEPYYNAGNAYDRRGDYNAAIEQAQRALQLADARLRAIAEYALGNHSVGAGKLDDAREAYRRALLADPSDADAKHNLEVVDRLRNASPTPTPTPEGQPAGAESSPAAGTPGPGSGTPDATAAAGGNGTPQAGDPRDLPPDEVRRQLQDALVGLDRSFTEEEALRILDLLDEANRRAREQQPSRASGALPDY